MTNSFFLLFVNEQGMWPKTTLEGVKAAIASRKLVSSQLVLKLQRNCAEAPAVDNLYELTLTRPLGLEIDGTILL